MTTADTYTSVLPEFDALATVATNRYQENIALTKLGNSRRLACVPAQR